LDENSFFVTKTSLYGNAMGILLIEKTIKTDDLERKNTNE